MSGTFGAWTGPWQGSGSSQSQPRGDRHVLQRWEMGASSRDRKSACKCSEKWSFKII